MLREKKFKWTWKEKNLRNYQEARKKKLKHTWEKKTLDEIIVCKTTDNVKIETHKMKNEKQQ